MQENHFRKTRKKALVWSFVCLDETNAVQLNFELQHFPVRQLAGPDRSGNLPDQIDLKHKGDSRLEPANFRPVSLTFHIIKTLERVIRKSMVSHLERNGLMDEHQHGSRSKRSTLSQLLQHHDEILKALEEGENVDSIYTDFSKAFDKCDHGILLHKLKRMKINGKLGRWVQNFLKSRQQIILVEKVKSNKSIIVSGIPQGSVLAPILFLIYISDIGEDILANTLVYVDDTKIKMSVKNESMWKVCRANWTSSTTGPLRIIWSSIRKSSKC